MYPRALTALINAFTVLPGVGSKTAERLAMHLVHLADDKAIALANAIVDVKNSVYICSQCGTLSDADLCPICQDSERNRGIITIVETSADLTAIEESGAYNGLYHVLAGNLSPMEGLGPNQLNIASLINRIGSATEIIIATNPTVEGEATADLLLQFLQKYPVKVSKLACGMPVGANLKYMDSLTVSHALNGRISIKK